MSGRAWRPGESADSWVTGDAYAGATVHWDCAKWRWVAEAWTRHEREMVDRGIHTHPAAMIVAEEWLDRREAETQQAQNKGGTT